MALKMGDMAKLFCRLALKWEGRLNWNNYGSVNVRQVGAVNIGSFTVETLQFHWPTENVFVTCVEGQLQSTVDSEVGVFILF